MASTPSKRPFCHRCTKPHRLCLCSRLKTPPLNNPISITILQHSLEKRHPLNSTRVAQLGFKNLAVVPVTDVNFTARFAVRPVVERSDFDKTRLAGFDNGDGSGDGSSPDQLKKLKCNGVEGGVEATSDPNRSDSVERLDFSGTRLVDYDNGDGFDNGSFVDQLTKHKSSMKKLRCIKLEDGVEAVFDKYRLACSAGELVIDIERTAKPDISWVLNTPFGRVLARNEFRVTKLQRKQLKPSSEELEDFEEFDIVIPPGAALLFPGGKSSFDPKEMDFEVKHLIVLDGTWAKAQRMYHENPWLKLLPHIKLDSEKESLYSEVRHQPKVGCLSTIESIVCALKGLGNDMEGLDDLLDVFESMIIDQRRCKDEKFKDKDMA
ncbi:uncharacterized protein A4U43_C07F37690 [Asparagus officinalis]|uniref:tRNA-uridine aminocarboxypropyltransferase n=2 Tax=Asparagus officinalis TaxID=4686 RepID=A0A5P1EHT2_ASPOF|nr:uncharacterized protein A4U43_C07F37690 [Asparagus officinalis]